VEGIAPLTAAIDHAKQQLVLRDELGAELGRVSIRRNDRLSVYPIYNMARARSLGHLLVVSLGNEVLAVDALAAVRGRGDAILWRRELAPPGEAGRTPTLTIGSVARQNPFGATLYSPNLQGRSIGELGPVSAQGVCFQIRSELVCLDPLTGDVIWKRGDVPEGCELLGDDTLLAAIPPDSGEATLYHAADGRLLGTRKLPEGEQRWESHGRNLLVWSEPEGRVELRLYDLDTGKDLLRKQFAPGVKATVADHRELAVLEPDGKFALYDLADGRERFSARLEPELRLESIELLRFDDQVLLMANRAITEPLPDVAVQAAPGGYYAPLVNGRLYAFDRARGAAVWSSPALIDQHGLPLDQPRGSPLLVLLRQLIKTSGTRQTHTSLLCLDRRDGRVVLANDSIPINSASFYNVTADEQEQTVKVSLPGKAFTIRLTDEPQPPAPPAQLSGARRGAGQIVGSLLDALGAAIADPAAGARRPLDAPPIDPPEIRPPAP
jgi:hypothetical protein